MERQRDENGGGVYGGRIVVGGGHPDALICVAYAYRDWQILSARVGVYGEPLRLIVGDWW